MLGAMLLALGCGDDDTGELASVECPSPDESLAVGFELGPCIDTECSDMDVSLWHAPPNWDQPVTAEVDLVCTAALESASDTGRRHLVGCSGSPDAPFGILVRLEGTLTDGLPLEPGAEVRVAHVWGSDGWYASWSSGTLRSVGGDLVALFTEGRQLPNDAFTFPLALRGRSIDCEPVHEECGGITRLGEVHVSLAEDSVSIPAHHIELIGTEPTYAVAVSAAQVAEGYQCGHYGSYAEFSVVALARGAEP
jgi:hypothetical protein